MIRICTNHKEAHGYAWVSQARAEFSNPSTSEIALSCENTSHIRWADGPAFSRLSRTGNTKTLGCDWLAKRGDILRRHPQARLRVSFKAAKEFARRINPGFSVEQTGSSLSVLIHEIRG